MKVGQILQDDRAAIGAAWVEMVAKTIQEPSRLPRVVSMLRLQAMEFLEALSRFIASSAYDVGTPNFSPLTELATRISAAHARDGQTPGETATFVLSLKDVLVPKLVAELSHEPQSLAAELGGINHVIDQIALATYAAFVKTREETILRQSEAIIELSTPTMLLWPEIVLMPLIGVIDTTRAQQVIEELLNAIVRERARVALLDITGVPVIDTRVALHLTKATSAARMLGAEVVLTGISADAAQTLVKLDIDLSRIRTRGTVRSGLEEALRLLGQGISDLQRV